MVKLGPQIITLPMHRGHVLGIINSLSSLGSGGSPAPLFHCLGAGLSLALVCEPRKGRAPVVLATPCPLGAGRMSGGLDRERLGAGPSCWEGVSEAEALFPFAFWPDLFSSQDPVFCSVTTT